MHPTLWVLIGMALGAAAAYALLIITGKNIVEQAKLQATQLGETSRLAAESKAREIELVAKEEHRKIREKFDKETEATKREMKEQEQRMSKREDTLDRKLDTLSVKEKNLDDLSNRLERREKNIAAKEAQLDQVLAGWRINSPVRGNSQKQRVAVQLAGA